MIIPSHRNHRAYVDPRNKSIFLEQSNVRSESCYCTRTQHCMRPRVLCDDPLSLHHPFSESLISVASIVSCMGQSVETCERCNKTFRLIGSRHRARSRSPWYAHADTFDLYTAVVLTSATYVSFRHLLVCQHRQKMVLTRKEPIVEK